MIEVLKQTMEALERSVATCFDQYAHQQVMSQPDHFINQAIASLRQAIAHLESQEPVALESFIKWDEDVEPVGEVVGFIQDSNYIMVKMHDEKQISLNDELYIHPPAVQPEQLTDVIPKDVLLAISNAGLTLVKTQHGYELRKLGPVVAHDIKE